MSRNQGLVVFLAAFSVPSLVFTGWWVKAWMDERYSDRTWGRFE